MATSVHGIGEIVAYLPYEFGFVPTDSTVLVGVRERQVVVTIRVDAPASAEVWPLARQLAAGLCRGDPDEAIVLCYDRFGAPDRALVRRLRSVLNSAGVEVTHVARVAGGRWRTEQCSCGGCRHTWADLPDQSLVGPIAEQVLRGVVPAANRAELERRFDLHHPLVAAAVDVEQIDVCPTRQQIAEALRRVLLDEATPVHVLPISVLATATAAVSRITVRDTVLAWLMPDFLSDEQINPDDPIDPYDLGVPPAHLTDEARFDDPVATVAQRLADWVGCIPVAYTVPVLLLAAGIYWTAGSGALAMIAVEQALDRAPDCRLALLFATAIQAGLRPARADERPA